MTKVCGTVGGPLPNDPDLNSSGLTARSGVNGISVSWTYPGVNAHAVAHTQLFRSTSDAFGTAQKINEVGGSYYWDGVGLTEGTRYYYWIKIVSINGTIGNLIGPATTVLQPSIDAIIAQLEGRINTRLLDSEMLTQINNIGSIDSGLNTEQQQRLFGEAVLSEMYNSLRVDLNNVDTLIGSEILQRTTADSALAAQVSIVLAKTGENTAAITEETVARTAESSAVAARVNTVEGVVEGVGKGAVQTLQNVVIGTAENPGITASYVLKTESSPTGGPVRIGGMGLWNTPESVDMVFLTDSFSIGAPSEDGNLPNAYPFMIGEVNGETQIVLNAKTLISDGHITNLMIGELIHSNDWNITDPYGAGWAIHKSGLVHFANVKVRGDVEATTLKTGTAMVNTLNIQGNAVTFPDLYVGHGGTPGAGSWQVVAVKTVWFGSSWPSAVIVTGAANFVASGDIRCSAALKVGMGGSTGGDIGVTLESGASGALTTTCIFYPSSSFQYFYLYAYVTGGAAYSMGAMTMTILGSKR